MTTITQAPASGVPDLRWRTRDIVVAAVIGVAFGVAFFVGGVTETLPVRVLNMMQGQVSPRINAVGSFVFAISMALVILAQIILLTRRPGRSLVQRA